MDIIKAKQCPDCLTWKQPRLHEAVSYLDTPAWAVIWYCPDPKCYEQTEPQ